MAIPKRIIQTSKTQNLSPISRGSQTNMRTLHPDWEYLFFDDAAATDFVKNEFPEFVATYQSLSIPIQKVDFFRYLVVYRLGGFYFDLDVLLYESLDQLTNSACVFPFECLTLSTYLRQRADIDWELGNYAFGAEAGHPFLAAIIKNCVRAASNPAWVEPMTADIPFFLRKDFRVLNSTGPGLVTRTYAESRSAELNVSILFTGDVCDRNSWFLFGDYGVHLMEGSWRSNGRPFRRIAERWWKSWRRSKQLPESHARGPRRKC